MTIRWYRSRSFWFGLPGLLLLLWTWAVLSRMDTREEAYLEWRWVSCTVVWGGSGIFLGAGYDSTPLKPGRAYGHYPVIVDDDHRAWLPPMTVQIPHSEGRWMTLEINLRFWFLTTAYTLIWIGVMIGWQRRKHRLMIAPGLLEKPSLPQ